MAYSSLDREDRPAHDALGVLGALEMRKSAIASWTQGLGTTVPAPRRVNATIGDPRVASAESPPVPGYSSCRAPKGTV